uniref:AMP-dependent synthetase/ligase domain-containing protein n=1 Tax=Amorphochlora amoebiformis TaxID=1561963 RepID=A0A7S0GVF9_9EUKA
MADSEAPIRYAKRGAASEEIHPAMTICDMIYAAKEKHGDKIALRVERVKEEKTGKMVTVPIKKVDGRFDASALPDGEWQEWTYKEYVERSEAASRALMHLGVEQFGTVGIYGFNSPEWFISLISTTLCGAKSAGIYPSDLVENVVFKLKHSKASVCILEDEKKLAKLQPQKDSEGKEFNPMDDLPELKTVVTWAASPDCPKKLDSKNGEVKIINWTEFLDLGKEVKEEDFKTRQAKIKPGHCCALIYTSGTTGRPKAVMMSHDNVTFEAANIIDSIRSSGIGSGGQERVVSYLPLSHVAGMMVDILAPIYLSARTHGYATVSFARPYDLKYSTIKDRLIAVKPTLFVGVPRVWEKIADKIKAKAKNNSAFAKSIASWAKPILLRHTKGFNLSQQPENPSMLWAANIIAKKVKAALGLTELKFGFTAAAPIQKETLEYYGSLGILVNEVYGMSECTGATTISLDEVHEWGSCGFAAPGCEVKILREAKDGKYEECPRAKDMFNATEEEQGEICFRGRHIMMGYLANPDFKDDGGQEWTKKKNESAIDEEGWLHSGDKGCMDTLGMIKITGRYKELIIGAGGENVAPVPVEGNVKLLQPAVANIMMVGDKKPFNVALVTLKVVGATGEDPGTNKLDTFAKIVEGVETIEQAIDSKEFTDLIWKAIDGTNKNPQVCPKGASKIQRFTILPVDFSVNGGELTSTLKTRRSVVAKKYAAAIEKLYGKDVSRETKYVNCFGKGVKI